MAEPGETSFVDELRARGLIQDIAHEQELRERAAKGSITFYCGIDPTADSLTVGHLVPIAAMRHLIHAGHSGIVVLGTVTGMIGDPSGKSEERNLLDRKTVDANCMAIGSQLDRLLNYKGQPPAVLKNGDWLDSMRMVEFLRDYGKHATVNTMLAKDSVRSRIENREQGISYTEFSYMLLQAVDFFTLYSERNCELQLGGSDQWGNITSGVDLIRRKLGKTAFAITFPLLLTSSGEKMGKTAAGAIWVDPSRTSPYEFYQYFLNVEDRDAGKFLRFFTLLTTDEIDQIEKESAAQPEARVGQRRLAEEMTRWVHGEVELQKAIEASQILFSGDVRNASAEMLLKIFAEVPSTSFARSQFLQPLSVIDLLVTIGAADSKGAARRTIEGGGIYINSERVADSKQDVTIKDFIDERVLIVRSGKKRYFLANIAK